MASLALSIFVLACSSEEGTVSGQGGANNEENQDIEELAPADASPESWPRFIQYIRSEPHERLVLEIDQVPAAAPEQQALDDLATYLEEILDKPGGVEVLMDDTLEGRGTDHEWTQDELDALAEDTFAGDEADALHIHVMYLDGQKTSDSGNTTLGLAWNYLNIAIFKESILGSCEDLPLTGNANCQKAELAILVHEAGHVLGLVDNGLPMVDDHSDPEHPHHDEDDACIMYWAYDGPGVFDSLGSLLDDQNGIEFCAPSLADIQAAR